MSSRHVQSATSACKMSFSGCTPMTRLHVLTGTSEMAAVSFKARLLGNVRCNCRNTLNLCDGSPERRKKVWKQRSVLLHAIFWHTCNSSAATATTSDPVNQGDREAS